MHEERKYTKGVKYLSYRIQRRYGFSKLPDLL